jgi:hypothetical protein
MFLVTGLLLLYKSDEGGLVASDGAGLVQPLVVGVNQGLPVGDDSVVDRVPVARQFGGHL